MQSSSSIAEFKKINIRFDANKVRIQDNMASVLDVIEMVTNHSASVVTGTWSRLQQTHPEFASNCSKLRYQGKGRFSPFASAPVLVEIIMVLPGKMAKEFRQQSAQFICRILGGDQSLADEIEDRSCVHLP